MPDFVHPQYSGGFSLLVALLLLLASERGRWNSYLLAESYRSCPGRTQNPRLAISIFVETKRVARLVSQEPARLQAETLGNHPKSFGKVEGGVFLK